MTPVAFRVKTMAEARSYLDLPQHVLTDLLKQLQGVKGKFLLSGYRSPATNAMLRSKSSGVARNSLHLKGQAADLRLKSRSVGQVAKAAEACASGGVGRYSRSNFVHMDCGPVRLPV